MKMHTTNVNSKQSNSLSNKPWNLLPALFVVLGLLGGVLYLIHERQVKREIEISVIDDALMHANANVAAFHRLFHEYASGDADVSLSDAMKRAESAEAALRLIVDGGEKSGVILPPLADPELLADVGEMISLIDKSAQMVERGFKARAAGGARAGDDDLDADYGRITALIEKMANELDRRRVESYLISRKYTAAMLTVWIGVTVLFALGSMIALKWRAHAESELRKLHKAVEQSPNCIVITDRDAVIEYVNPRFVELTGYTLEEAVGQNPRILKSGRTPEKVYEELWATLTAGRIWRGEFLNKKKNDELYWETASIAPITDERGEVTHYVAVKEDISALKAEQAERERLLRELEAALKNVRTLSGLIPICSYCKKMRDDKGYWQKVETFVRERTDAEFTHGICEACAEKVIGDSRREAGLNGKDK